MKFETRPIHDMHGYSFEYRETGLKWWQILFGDHDWLWTRYDEYWPDLEEARKAAIDVTAKMNTPRRVLEW